MLRILGSIFGPLAYIVALFAVEGRLADCRRSDAPPIPGLQPRRTIYLLSERHFRPDGRFWLGWYRLLVGGLLPILVWWVWCAI